MDAASQSPNYVEMRSVDQHVLRQEKAMCEENRPRPVAMRVEEISENEFEALCRIAENPNAPAGVLKHVPRRIPVRNREVVES